MSNDLLTKTASDLGRMIGSKEVSPTEVTEAFLSEIDKNPLTERIYARTTPDRARAEAKAATDRAQNGTRIGPLDGVPISWKDLFDTAGITTEAGSKLLDGRTPTADATVLKNATLGGLVCLGKTHMSELAFSGLGVNPITRTPPCVNDLDAAPGGSSSGSAASVAFNLAPASIGSDTGGSVRIPSAWNDIVGLKTTHGLLPTTGSVPLCTKFDTVGPMCRSVEDTANLFAALAGERPMPLIQSNIKGKRFAICTTAALDDMDSEPQKAFERNIEALKAAGAIIEELEIPEVAHALPLSSCLFTTEAYAQWGETIAEKPNVMFSEIEARFMLGKGFSGAEYIRAWHKLDALRASYVERVAAYDAILMPTACVSPPNVKRLSTDSDYYIRVNLLALRNTRISNLLGLCAITLPSRTPSCGLMICGKPFEERKILSIASQMEPILG
ncbi:amidase [Amylibacter sp. SFDW26]|uniref:amidase n=1 Tax=Amylibacter sp. SFDW26 TaxID=2652722 RepID=UPI0012625E5C|nr:amidase [Amylibacter sp. SFDW26]KAB7614485.1 amidase [Amylibacter sp. SFDW26]